MVVTGAVVVMVPVALVDIAAPVDAVVVKVEAVGMIMVVARAVAVVVAITVALRTRQSAVGSWR